MIRNISFLFALLCTITACSYSSNVIEPVQDPIIAPAEPSAYDAFARSMTIAKEGKIVLFPLDSEGEPQTDDVIQDGATPSPYSQDVTIYEFGRRDSQPIYQ